MAADETSKNKNNQINLKELNEKNQTITQENKTVKERVVKMKQELNGTMHCCCRCCVDTCPNASLVSQWLTAGGLSAECADQYDQGPSRQSQERG